MPVSIVAAIRDASILLHDCRDASIPTARLCHQLCQHCAMLVRLLLWLSATAHAIAVNGRQGEVVGARGRIASLTPSPSSASERRVWRGFRELNMVLARSSVRVSADGAEGVGGAGAVAESTRLRRS